MLCNGAIAWSAKDLTIIPTSTCEAETATGSRATKDTLFARELNIQNGRAISNSTSTLGDNKAMFDLIRHEGASVRTRFYERCTMFIKRAVLLLILRPYLVATEYMIADIFTKATDRGTYFKFRNVIMNMNGGLRANLERSLSAVHGAAARAVTRLMDCL